MAVALVGCGGGSTTTSTPTSEPAYSAGYPLSFEASFTTSCMNSGASRSSCACDLRFIEQHVAYQTVVGQLHDIAIGNLPSWYSQAKSACP